MRDTTKSKNILDRGTVIGAVKNPLNFFTLVVLVVEAIFGMIVGLTSNPRQDWLIAAMIVLVFALVGIVAFMACFRPESLRGDNTNSDRSEIVQIYAERIDDVIEDYIGRKEEAKDVSLVSIAASGALDDYITNDLLLERICRHHCEVRILFLRPDSEHVRIRHWQDGLGPMGGAPQRTIDNLKQSIAKVKVIHDKLQGLHKKYESFPFKDRSSLGKFEVRLLDIVPNMTLFISDRKILWGVYTSVRPGHESTVLEVTERQEKLFEDLKGHFEHLWSERGTWLLRYSQETRGPKLNQKLSDQLTNNDKGLP